MSIFFDFDVGPTGRRLRRAVEDDKYDIERLVCREHTVPLFGDADIGALIELSTLAICMINEKKEVTGFMALGDHPVQVAIEAADWEIWIRNMFNRFYLSRNTLFIHFMCCSNEVIDVFMREAIVAVFVNDVYLTNILLLVPKGCPEECYLKYNVFNFNPTCKLTAKRIGFDKGMFMYLAQSKDFCPKLKLRRAVQEDNDEIVEILDKKCKRLKDLYGEYYIAELVGYHPESKRRIIVGELPDKSIAGVMCLNTEINYENLQKSYNLRPFYGLTKPTPLEREKQRRSNKLLQTFGEPIMTGQWSPFSRRPKIDTQKEQSQRNRSIENRKRSLSHVNFEFNAEPVCDDSTTQSILKFEHQVENHKDIKPETPTPGQSIVSVTELLQEDPFEYDILNIDEGLLFTLAENGMNSDSDGDETEMKNIELVPGPVKKPSSRNSITKAGKRLSEVLMNVKPDKTVTTKFVGEPNAFMIELFALREDVHERHAFDLLGAAFEIMKQYDYCIIKVPLEESLSLLQHFCYVPTVGDTCTDFALYVAHRSAIFGKLRVRDAEIADIPQIAKLMYDMDGYDTIWTVESTLMKQQQNKVYVMMCGGTVVGFGILEPPEHIDYIRTRFLLESYHIHKYHLNEMGCGFAIIKTAMVYGAFEQHLRFFARDMLRLSGCNSLFWLTAYRNKLVSRKVNTLASAMIPLMPRKIKIDCPETPELRREALLSKNIMPFAVWYLSKKYCSMSKSDINTRIVVVGTSRTSMAFLDNLLFGDSCTYLSFNNVTLISPTGLPYVRDKHGYSAYMFKIYNTSSDNYIKSVPYTYYVNMIQATLVDINKKLKYVTVSTGAKVYYDILVLTFGKQYQPPDYFEAIMKKEQKISICSGKPSQYQRLDIPRNNEEAQISMKRLPENVFIINNHEDSARAVSYINKFTSGKFSNLDYNVIVYGETIHAYCCITALLDMNIHPKNIVFVEPFPPEDQKKTRVPFFCNYNVDQTMNDELKTLGITVYRSYYFLEWTVGSNNVVTRVDFLSHLQKISLDCMAFFYYGKKGINHHAFVAINKSGIAYNDGILIDHNFQTKHPSVYAAGPATRYYGKYFAGHKHHKFFDSYELGKKLAEVIRDKLDPLFKPKYDKNQQRKSSVSSNTLQDEDKADIGDIPELRKPIVTYCILPGNMQYLEVRPPGSMVPHYFIQSLHYNGFVLETFKQGYFKLHLNRSQVVDGITCLSPASFDLEKFKELYGKPTNVLNNVFVKYVTKRIDDFFEFFHQPWAQFLYIDNVDEVFDMVKEILPQQKKEHKPVMKVYATVEESDEPKLLAMESTLSTASGPAILPRPMLKQVKSVVELRPNLVPSFQMDTVIKYLLDWIEQRDILLPMYMHPSKELYFRSDVKSHPAFRNKKKSVSKLLRTVINKQIE